MYIIFDIDRDIPYIPILTQKDFQLLHRSWNYNFIFFNKKHIVATINLELQAFGAIQKGMQIIRS